MVKKMLVSGMLSLFLLQSITVLPVVLAAEPSVETAADAGDKPLGSEEGKKEKKGLPSSRFMKILFDSTYTYYMDTENVRWIICPHTNNEQVVDVWIKMVPDSDALDAGKNYTYPAKYYLEHYYIRPSAQQIQFLCELEVTGRPDNNIQERPYSAGNWENLVPGSVEDSIYHAVLANIKNLPAVPKKDTSGTLSDMVDEYLRISL